MKIGAVILAAGESTRMRTCKQLLSLGGKPLLQHVIDAAETVGFYRIVVILGANCEDISVHIKTGANTEVRFNTQWRDGQSTSVRTGVELLEAECDAIVFLLGDQPFISKDLIQKEIQLFSETRADIVAPRFEGVRGNPVLFSTACYKDLRRLEGDRGGKQIFADHQVREFEYSNIVENKDIDSIDDYEQAKLLLSARSQLCTIILGAGLSSRMKQPKLLMPWGNSTVLGTVINAFHHAGVGDVRVVTGGFRELVEEEAYKNQATSIFNPAFENGAMLDSVKTGLQSFLETKYAAAFIALGDQPAVASEDILQMAKLFFESQAPLIIPSFEMRRGHPWLVSCELWSELLDLLEPKTMRDFIETNKDVITYYAVKSSRILDDLDTPEDYDKYRPR